MLVLSRHPEEAIVINGNIVVTILSVRPKWQDLEGKWHRVKVRVGVEAPEEISVHRREVQELIDGWHEEAEPGANT